jgi:hypothetical protein
MQTDPVVAIITMLHIAIILLSVVFQYLELVASFFERVHLDKKVNSISDF